MAIIILNLMFCAGFMLKKRKQTTSQRFISKVPQIESNNDPTQAEHGRTFHVVALEVTTLDIILQGQRVDLATFWMIQR